MEIAFCTIKVDATVDSNLLLAGQLVVPGEVPCPFIRRNATVAAAFNNRGEPIRVVCTEYNCSKHAHPQLPEDFQT